MKNKKIKEEIKTPSITVIIGTPESDGYRWTYTTHVMTKEEYHATKRNLASSSCSISTIEKGTNHENSYFKG